MICLTNKFFKNEMLSQEMFGAQSGLQKQNILSTAGRPAPHMLEPDVYPHSQHTYHQL